MDWNPIVDALIDEIAVRVVNKIREADGSSWPNIHPDQMGVVPKEWNVGYTVDGVDDPGDEVVTPEPEPEEDKAVDYKAERREYWHKKTAEVIRNTLAAYEGVPLHKYKNKSKQDLVQYAADLECLSGHNLPELQRSEPKPELAEVPEPEEDEELSEEVALTLPLAELKEIAKEYGSTDEDLQGLDVEAVVDLIFAPDTVLTQEQLLDMDRGELESIAEREGIAYEDSLSRQDLALLLVSELAE